jgi:selenobiotic family peptide radical SAM maturase
MIREHWLLGRKCSVFTLQWHLTNACSFHCRHCYDRSDRSEPGLEEALKTLSDLQAFGRRHRVKCRLTLSGGDPLLYTRFWELYRAIAAAQLPVAILGNPIAPEVIGKLLAIQPPSSYQVSLEGLREHNDAIRGPGHYDQTLSFLVDARRLGLSTQVMLTLTKANLEQVLPLAESLRGLTVRFSFNRLAQVGEGAALELPSREDYAGFLERYLAARRQNPLLGVKDNLFNIIRRRYRRPLFPGCTGFGCGAAFNFVALLPDGEVHACRKYPSPIGNLHQAGLEEIYSSPIARRYRRGAAACQGCRLRKACGGCPAVTFGQGLDPFEDKDPFCFLA